MKKRIAALLALLFGGFVALMLFVVLPTSRLNVPAALTGNGTSSAPLLTDIQRIEDLKTRFNQDAGTPRLVLLLSPT